MAKVQIPESLRGLQIPVKGITVASVVAYQRRYTTAQLYAHRKISRTDWLTAVMTAVLAERGVVL